MNIPVLYTFRRCPYAMRARLAVASAGITVELREILLRDKPAEMLAASPKATVPVMISGDHIIDESRDIMDWALNRNDPEGWLDRRDIALVKECEGSFKDALDKYKYATRYKDINREEQRSLASLFLQNLEHILSTQSHLSGSNIGYTDMAIVTFVRQFANVERDWFDQQNWPNLIRWLDDFLISDRFAFIMEKYPVWNGDASPIYFPRQK